MDLFRETPAGQLIRLVTGNKFLQYPEERGDFVCPTSYGGDAQDPQSSGRSSSARSSVAADAEKKTEQADFQPPDDGLTTTPTRPDVEGQQARRPSRTSTDRTLSKSVSRPNLSRAGTRADVEQAYEDAVRQQTLQTEASHPIAPAKTSDGRILVDWYTSDDPANPQNWSRGKKLLVVSQIYLYTLAVYLASAIYTPSVPYVIEQFGVSSNMASLGLSIYVLGYGWGPLLFSPLSEIPVIGRNPPYAITFFIYLILSIGTATVDNFNGLIALRFFQGFFGSPALATGGASLGDLYSLINLPYAILAWAAFATTGPALGPIISGFSVPKTNWHWSLWEVVWLAAPVLVSMLLTLPETSAPTILLHRAQRLRKRTGNPRLVSQSEIDQASMTARDIVVDNLWHPVQINALDPAVLFTSVYIGLVYGIFYSFFESFPLVYGTGIPNSRTHGYGFNAGVQGLIFLSVSVGVIIAIVVYVAFLHYYYNPRLLARIQAGQGLGAPESRLVPGLYASFLVPVGLFIFAWTGYYSPDVHWIAPTIGVAVFTFAVFILFQVVFIYIPLTYPQYSASLFAGNDVVRSSMAAGAIHFAHPLFNNLGIGRGVSLLGGVTGIGIIGIWVLYLGGAWLRSKSRFAAK